MNDLDEPIVVDDPATEIAVLLMAYGGPDSLRDVAAYLQDVRGGRPTPPDLVAEIQRRYELIGGRSPLLEITRAQARFLEGRLNGKRGGLRFHTYVGMRHWYPFIRDALEQIAGDGIRHVIALGMAPHYSRLSTGRYAQTLREARQALDVRLDLALVQSWHTHPLFIRAIVKRVRQTIERFPPEARGQIAYVFTAHSLPASIVEQGDPYDFQLRETAHLVTAQLGLSRDDWQFCYQSAPAGQTAWLGPSIQEVVVNLATSGRTSILVTPIGFVADHLEILYDLDREARGLAEQAGARFERSESLNAGDDFIEALADIVLQQLGAPLGAPGD